MARALTSSSAPPLRRSARATFSEISKRRRSGPMHARWASATGNTGTSRAPCISRLRLFAGRRSPSATRKRHRSKRARQRPASASASGRQRGLGLLGDRLERRRLCDGEIRQHLAVDRDARLRQAVDEDAVGHAERANRGIDALDPERAEGALLALAIAEGILAGLLDRSLGGADGVLAAAAETLGGLVDFLVLGVRGHTAFDAGHDKNPSKDDLMFGSPRKLRRGWQ